MVPPKTDPGWNRFLNNLENYAPKSLPTKILMTRLKLISKQGSAEAKKAMVDAAFDFFTKNEVSVKDDIKLIFG